MTQIIYDPRAPIVRLLDDLRGNLAVKEHELKGLGNRTKGWLLASVACVGLPLYFASNKELTRELRLINLTLSGLGTTAAIVAKNQAGKYRRKDREVWSAQQYVDSLQAEHDGAQRVAYEGFLGQSLKEYLPQEAQQQQQQAPAQTVPVEWAAEAQLIQKVFRKAGHPVAVKDKDVIGDKVIYSLVPIGDTEASDLKGLSGKIKDELLVWGGMEDAEIKIGRFKIELIVTDHYRKQIKEKQQPGFTITARQPEREAVEVRTQQEAPPQPFVQQPFNPGVPQNVNLAQPHVHAGMRIMLGDSRMDGQPRYWDLAKQANGFFLALGASGSGKTEALKVLSTEIREYGIPVLVTDFHGDIELGGFKTITLSHSPTMPYGVNPLELDSTDPKDGGVYAQINIVLAMLQTCVSGMGHRQHRMIKQALQTVYEGKGIKDSDPSTYTRPAPTFANVIAALEVAASDEDLPGNERNIALSCLSVVGKVFEHPIFSKPKQLSIPELSKGWYRLNLKHLEEDIKFAVADTLLRKASRYLRSQGHISVQPRSDRDRFRWFFMVDEAKILSMGGANKDDSSAPLNKAATEDRKFGLGLCLFSQITDHFSKELLAQFAARLVMKPFDAEEARANAATIGVAPEQLMALEGKGDSFLKLGNGAPAERITVRPTFQRPNYRPYVVEPEDDYTPESPEIESFDERFEEKFGQDPDEIFEDQDQMEGDDPYTAILNWIEKNHPGQADRPGSLDDETLNKLWMQWFTQHEKTAKPLNNKGLAELRKVLNAKRNES